MIKHWFSCSNPRLVTNPYTSEKILVPCGSCPSCRVRHITRLLPSILREGFCHKYCDFITLTYSDNFLPTIDLNNYFIDPKFQKRYEYLYNKSEEFCKFYNDVIPVVKYSHIQKFIKRLRSLIKYELGEGFEFRYVISGDYGGTAFRPHYHGLLFYDQPRLNQRIKDFIGRAWSVRVQHGQRELFGFFKIEPAYAAGSYVASYTQAISDLPSIYLFRDFKAKCLHSSSPSLGSLLRPLESIKEIVKNGLTEVTFYDPKTSSWKKTPLSPSYLYRLFPNIPSFSRLTVSERYEVYRIFNSVKDLEPFFRRLRLKHLMNVNSFLYDYITYGKSLTRSQLDSKLDRIHFVISRLRSQASLFDCSVYDYDRYIDQYFSNLSSSKLKFQLDYVDSYNKFHGTTGVPSHVDCLKQSNIDDLILSPDDHLFFNRQKTILNSLIKRKCDNDYLTKHPEFQKFHNYGYDL